MNSDKTNVLVESNTALRFNKGKVRLDLVPDSAVLGIGDVMTYGASKYAERNWEKGLDWMSVVASLERHLKKFKKGEDFDDESTLLHIDHVLANAAFLKEYYKIYPQGDNRPHAYLNRPRIGLDIDDVLADWLGSFCKYQGIELPNSWLFHRDLSGAFDKMKEDGVDIDNWMENLPVKTRPEDIPFEPAAYITARTHTPKWVAEKWLDKNGFPAAPVYQVPGNKVQAAKEAGIDIFVDDRFDNFVDLNKAGICCYLFNAPHNQRYNVGHKRIHSLKELV